MSIGETDGQYGIREGALTQFCLGSVTGCQEITASTRNG